nr:DUF4162 domain-containing protein [Candidatus Freyarchaeota archaeon]
MAIAKSKSITNVFDFSLKQSQHLGVCQKAKRAGNNNFHDYPIYMDKADKLCNRVAIIDYGNIVSIGTPNEPKGMLGGDIVLVHTNDSEAFLNQVKKLKFVSEVSPREGGIRITVNNGETAIPKLFEEANKIGVSIDNISLSRPTLDDVFIKFTGRSLRTEKTDMIELFKSRMLMQRRRRK